MADNEGNGKEGEGAKEEERQEGAHKKISLHQICLGKLIRHLVPAAYLAF